MKIKNIKVKLLVLGLVTIIFFLIEKLANSGISYSEVMHPTTKFASWAFFVGAISSISLIIGSVCGIMFTPKPYVTAALTAFGAGALLAALSVELIAPTVMSIVGQIPDATAHDPSKSHAAYTMGALIIGCILGGILFVAMDELVNSKGGYKRKISTLIDFIRLNKKSEIIHQDLEGKDIVKMHNAEEHKEEHSTGPMAIWLGLLIDGIPESFVIGAGFLGLLTAKLAQGVDPQLTEILPYTLIAGLFLSNFPEALSSSVGMKKQGLSVGKILLLWGSMVLMISIGSVVGYYVGSEIPHEYEIGIEGIAAGAMLTMIAQTMIPEAVHIGGNKVVGLSTLIGYLSAVAFKLLE